MTSSLTISGMHSTERTPKRRCTSGMQRGSVSQSSIATGSRVVAAVTMNGASSVLTLSWMTPGTAWISVLRDPVVAVLERDHGAVGVHRCDCFGDHALHDLVGVERAVDETVDLVQRRAEVRRFSLVFDQPRVLDGQRRGDGQLAAKIDLGLVERPGLPAVEQKAADDGVPDHERHGEHGLQRVRLDKTDVDRLVGRHVGDGQRLPSPFGKRGVRRLVDGQAQAEVVGREAALVAHDPARRVAHLDRAGVDVERLHAMLEGALHDVVEIERRVDELADVVQGLRQAAALGQISAVGTQLVGLDLQLLALRLELLVLHLQLLALCLELLALRLQLPALRLELLRRVRARSMAAPACPAMASTSWISRGLNGRDSPG